MSEETYDFIVVGAGMSGLSSAYFYAKQVGRDAKILILDNHDDFGGHAKRNEMVYNGKMMVINGGTLELEAEGHYSQQAKDMLADIAAPQRFASAGLHGTSASRCLAA